MTAADKTKEQLIAELRDLHRRLADMESREEDYRNLFENFPIGLYQVTPRGRILRANLHAAGILGYDSPAALIAAITDITTQVYLEPEQRIEALRLLRENGHFENLEVQCRHKEGWTVWISLNVWTVRDKAGNILYHEGTSQDITRRKAAEQAKETANKSLTDVMNAIDAVVYVADMRTHEILYINDCLRNTNGDVVGKTCWQAIQHLQTGPCPFCSNDRLLGPDGKPTAGVVWEFQDPRNGRWYECRDKAVYWPDGRIVRMEIATDITERKTAEERQKKTEKESRDLLNFLQTLIDTIPSPIFCKDIKGCYQDCNKEFEVYVGKKKEEIIGKTAPELFAKDMADKYREMDIFLFRQPGRQIYEHQIIYADGSLRDVVVNKATYRNTDGTTAGIVGVMVDITARKEAEMKVHAALREKERLLHEIHHRVKNNMQVISCLLDLQALSSGDPEVIKMAEESNKRIRAMALIHEKLYQSKDFSRINLGNYMRELAMELSHVYKINPQKIAISIKEKKDVFLNMDRAIPCGLVLSELFSNACKHAFPGDRPGEIKVTIDESSPREIKVVISDNGIGLPGKIDIQGPRSVGLYLVRGLVKNQLHGQLETRIDNGTEFTIKFR